MSCESWGRGGYGFGMFEEDRDVGYELAALEQCSFDYFLAMVCVEIDVVMNGESVNNLFFVGAVPW